jgi:hypothetical protein
MEIRIYAPLWNKYRPAILQLMTAAANGPQQYKFSKHEFQGLNPNHKTGFSFSLVVSKGKSTNNIRGVLIAQQLLEVLQQSKRAWELMEEAPYELTLDRKFILHVTRIQEATATEEKAVAQPEAEAAIA